MEKKVGIVQYLCPETTALGLMRNPRAGNSMTVFFFRSHCKELLENPLIDGQGIH